MTQEALKLALEAMESVTVECNNFHHPKKDQNHDWAKCPPVARWDKAITAIKEALAQPEQSSTVGYAKKIESLIAERDALKAKLAEQPEQEPVAWGVDWGRAGDIPCVSIIKRIPNGGIEVMAVEYAPYSYTTPPQQEPVIDKSTAKRIATALGWTPPRTWIGLTDEEIDYLIHLAYTGDEEFVQTIEAKLKEKNLPCINPKWIWLTEKEHADIAVECGCMSADWVFYGAAVERNVKERNT